MHIRRLSSSSRPKAKSFSCCMDHVYTPVYKGIFPEALTVWQIGSVCSNLVKMQHIDSENKNLHIYGRF